LQRPHQPEINLGSASRHVRNPARGIGDMPVKKGA
jgi:hypothetical protein